jgi:hypothetical protein
MEKPTKMNMTFKQSVGERTILRDFSSTLRWIKSRANLTDLKRVQDAYRIATERFLKDKKKDKEI